MAHLVHQELVARQVHLVQVALQEQQELVVLRVHLVQVALQELVEHLEH
jgi:hypothetical protein